MNHFSLFCKFTKVKVSCLEKRGKDRIKKREKIEIIERKKGEKERKKGKKNRKRERTNIKKIKGGLKKVKK